MGNWFEVREGETRIQVDVLLRLLLRYSGLIMSAAIGCAAAFFYYSKQYVTPTYSSSILMYVSNWVDDGTGETTRYITSSDVDASQNLVNTYVIVLKSKPTLEAVLEQTNLPYTVYDLKSMISTSVIDETELFYVTVTAADPEDAADIANAIAEVAPEEITRAIVGSSAKVIEYAEPSISPSYPNNTKNALRGFILGFMVSTMGVLVMSLLRNGRSAEDKLESEFGETAILASVPEFSGSRKKKRQIAMETQGKLDFAASESYKMLRTKLPFCFADTKQSHVIGITSSARGEGRTTTAIYLSQALAQAGHSVCLVDGDLRMPAVDKKLHIDSMPGLVNQLTGQSEVVVKQVTLGEVAFGVVPSGSQTANPSELLGSDQMQLFVKKLQDEFDYIILDLPSVGRVSDALSLAKVVDGMLLVVREDFYDRRMIAKTRQQLDAVEEKNLGIVITHAVIRKKRYTRTGRYRKKYDYA